MPGLAFLSAAGTAAVMSGPASQPCAPKVDTLIKDQLDKALVPLANHPRVILCDEATSALDSLTTNSVLKLLRQINQDMGVTMVVITHEIGVVEKICNRVAVIDGSRIVEQGSAAEVLEDPQADVTRRLLGRVRWDA